jgi:hypothetical protein
MTEYAVKMMSYVRSVILFFFCKLKNFTNTQTSLHTVAVIISTQMS